MTRRTVRCTAVGFGIRRLNIWLYRKEELEYGSERWQVWGPPILTAVLFALQVVTGRTFRPQGRDWLPVLFGVFLFAVALAPRALPRRLRRPTSNALLAGVLVYCLVGTPLDRHRHTAEPDHRPPAAGRALVPRASR